MPYSPKHKTTAAGMTITPRGFTKPNGNPNTKMNAKAESRWRYRNGVGDVTIRISASHDWQNVSQGHRKECRVKPGSRWHTQPTQYRDVCHKRNLSL